MSVSPHIIRREAGPQWLVGLHGLQSSSELFEILLNDPRFSQFSFLGIDLVGFGKSPKPVSFSYDLADQAALVIEVLKQQKIPPGTLIGHSVGGMIGTMLLKMAPDCVSQLVSLEGNLSGDDCGISLPASLVPEAERPAFYEKLKQRIGEEPMSGESRVRWLQDIPEFVFFETARSIVRWSQTGELYEVFQNSPHRKMLILGQNSGYRSRPAGPNIIQNVIKGAGHFMVMEQPEETRRAILRFLS